MTQRKQMNHNANDTKSESTSLTFSYPENRDKTVSNLMLAVILVGFLVYMVFRQEEMLGKYVFSFATFIVLLQMFIDMKTFFLIDEVVIDDMYLILKKVGKVRFKTPLRDLAFKVTKNPIDYSNKIVLDFYELQSNNHLISLSNKDISQETFEQFIQILSTVSTRDENDFQETSHRQLLSLFPENINDRTMQGELVKATHQAVFAKYGAILVIGLMAIVSITLYLVKQ